MSKQVKSDLTIDKTNIVNNQAINASDVLIPFEDSVNEIKNGWLRVSENDTTVKHLFDAFITDPIGVKFEIVNPGADEQISFEIDTDIVCTPDNNIDLENKTFGSVVISNNQFSSAQHNHEDDSNGGKISFDSVVSGNAGEGYVLTANGAGEATWAVPPNSISKAIDLIATAGEDLLRNDMVYLDSDAGKWFKIDIDSSESVKLSSLRGCVTQNDGIATNATGTVRIFGEVDSFVGLTPWQKIYAGTIPGTYTQSKPSSDNFSTQFAIAEMGYALNTTKVFMNIKPVTYFKRDVLDDNSVAVVNHHKDSVTQTRKTKAFVVNADSQYAEPCVVGRWNSGIADVAVRFDDNTGNNSETYTTFKNVSSQQLDLILEVTII